MRGIKIILIGLGMLICSSLFANHILLPMDATQSNHMKSYGVAYNALKNGYEIQWLLNYRGGSFALPFNNEIKTECLLKGVSFEVLTPSRMNTILSEIAAQDVNADAIKLEKAPKIAVYSPKEKKPWDDAVTLSLTYAEIPYTVVYDSEVLDGKLADYDWLHLHHEDFTGQMGKFYAGYRHMDWYKEEEKVNKETAKKYGYTKISELKKAVVRKVRDYVNAGGFMFAMCSATDTYDIALAAMDVDIVATPFDGDPADPDAQAKLDYSKTFAFRNFKLEMNPNVYEYSDIDMTDVRKVQQKDDFFVLFEFSAKWDPVPTMLCQNHENVIKGFMGQTTAFKKSLIKPNVLIMGENKVANEARYIHGEYGKGTWTFYGGHDPEDFQHFVGDSPTDLNLHKQSPGYRLILNNVLFPAAKKKQHKT
ncbi:asparagine synthetase B [Odoribacter sp. OttesenSCG-928-J03]|nr:asparagine synthetase B [Odoribacter sp. OttesenSCG-928-J03]MDL2330672.1 asparagine synthetase B [Odoribacter sp. OttesenSCG-928-A06]